jgi:hypothetical protein
MRAERTDLCFRIRSRPAKIGLRLDERRKPDHHYQFIP